MARELALRGAGEILILEKEPSLGAHASGRNSGVVHAGLYYTPDTLKARFCVEGNTLLKTYCRENGLTLRETGKVIVTRGPEELGGLLELKRRADASGAVAEIIDGQRLHEIEPHASTFEKAIYSPNTAVIRPKEVLEALAQELRESGRVSLLTGTAFLGVEGSGSVRSSQGSIRFGHLINTAGAFADQVAHQFGLGREYKILPFKGTYMKAATERTHLVLGNVYPVPDLRNPFLGTHFTRTADDEVYVGPTAIPAFGREDYGLPRGIGRETADILWRDLVLLFRNAGFRSAALSEPKKVFKRRVFAEARRLVPALRLGDLQKAEKVGIRPQLVHWPSKKLVLDFVILRDGSSLHVLNAISPAFTSSMAFARHAVDLLLEAKGQEAHALPI
jgi:L-2-hydroxyglutarate oxidase LhgO